MQFKYRNNQPLRFNIDLRGLVHLYRLSGGYFATTIINQALPFLILPVLTRYLSPAEYGSFALFYFYLTVSNALSGLSITNFISKIFFTSDKKQIAGIIGNSILIVGVFSFITLIIILILYSFFQFYLNLPLLWLVLIPFTSFAIIVFAMGLNVLLNSKKVLLFSKHQVGNTAINLGISLLLVVVLLRNWEGRAMGIIFSYFISALISLYYLNKNDFVSFTISKNQINNILKVVIPLTPNAVQSVVISQAGMFFIQYYFTRELLGLYSIGFQLAALIYLLVSTLSMSWSPYLYEQMANGDKINKQYLTRLFYALFGILFIGALFINLISLPVLKIMTTPEYYAANEFVPWLTLGFFFQGLYLLFYPVLIYNNKQQYISLVSFVNMLIMIILNIWFIKLFGHIGVAYAFSLTNIFMFIPLILEAQKVMPLPWLKALKIWN
jgi:O-antigen/teichoic acid export membrane protein